MFNLLYVITEVNLSMYNPCIILPIDAVPVIATSAIYTRCCGKHEQGLIMCYLNSSKFYGLFPLNFHCVI